MAEISKTYCYLEHKQRILMSPSSSHLANENVLEEDRASSDDENGRWEASESDEDDDGMSVCLLLGEEIFSCHIIYNMLFYYMQFPLLSIFAARKPRPACRRSAMKSTSHFLKVNKRSARLMTMTMTMKIMKMIKKTMTK